MDTTLKAILESAFTTSTSMNLCFDDDLGAEAFGSCLGVGSCLGYFPSRSGNSKFFKKIFGLIFVDIHREKRLLKSSGRQLTGRPLEVKVELRKDTVKTRR